MAGYDIYEDKRTFEQEGITGEVTRYTKVDVTYPYFMLINHHDGNFPLYKMKTLPSLLVNAKTQQSGVDGLDKSIEIYFKDGERAIRLGKILPKQVKGFLNIFDGCDVKCMLNETTELQGDYMYILAD